VQRQRDCGPACAASAGAGVVAPPISTLASCTSGFAEE
jgi:hypothetical protein